MARTKKEKVLKEYDGPMAKYLVIKETPYTDEKGNPAGILEVGSIQDMPTILGDGLVKDGFMELYKEPKEEETIVLKVISQPDTYNGKKIISKRDVEINGKSYKEITTEEGSTYLI